MNEFDELEYKYHMLTDYKSPMAYSLARQYKDLARRVGRKCMECGGTVSIDCQYH